jgi:hypothetical protein
MAIMPTSSGEAMKPMNVFSMVIMLIVVILLIIYLRPH